MFVILLRAGKNLFLHESCETFVICNKLRVLKKIWRLFWRNIMTLKKLLFEESTHGKKLKYLSYFLYYKRLRWCRGRVLASDNQVRGFKPGRSRRIFKRAIKILSTPSFGKEVKLSVPCRRFAASKRTQAPSGHHFSPIVPPLAARGLPRVVDARGTWRPE
jgi:hypothetical protein